MPKQYDQACPVAKSLELLGERWTLLIVRDLLGRPRRFHDLRASLAPVAPAVLSQRLKILEEHGIVRRTIYTDRPPRAEYALTERGLGLRAVVRALAVWGARHVHRGSALVHTTCGGRIDMAYYCTSCETLVPGDAVHHHRFARRPSARVRRPARRRPRAHATAPTAPTAPTGPTAPRRQRQP